VPRHPTYVHHPPFWHDDDMAAVLRVRQCTDSDMASVPRRFKPTTMWQQCHRDVTPHMATGTTLYFDTTTTRQPCRVTAMHHLDVTVTWHHSARLFVPPLVPSGSLHLTTTTMSDGTPSFFLLVFFFHFITTIIYSSIFVLVSKWNLFYYFAILVKTHY
jgi:hypothetical protein